MHGHYTDLDSLKERWDSGKLRGNVGAVVTLIDSLA